jgi:hypothetical protein
MKPQWIAVLMLAGSSMFLRPVPMTAAAVLGPPPPVRILPVPAPRPGRVWVPGYYFPRGRSWAWRGGYWARPPFRNALWVAPRYFHGRYYGGYWRH